MQCAFLAAPYSFRQARKEKHMFFGVRVGAFFRLFVQRPSTLGLLRKKGNLAKEEKRREREKGGIYLLYHDLVTKTKCMFGVFDGCGYHSRVDLLRSSPTRTPILLVFTK